MANERGKAIDNTHLSIDQAEERGFIHRDYIAHCLRWSHVAKYVGTSGRYRTTRVLDVGCGVDLPLARLLYSSRLIVQEYVGVDYNRPEKFKMDMFHTGKMPVSAYGDVDAAKDISLVVDEESTTPITHYRVGDDFHRLPNVITSFEVMEHIEPEHCRRMLFKIGQLMGNSNDSVAFLSTPCYDAHTGAAANHVSEITYQAFGALLEDLGFAIEGVWGTFASQKDYKHLLTGDLATAFTRLSEYYDSNYVATIFAPMFPAQSRNACWQISVAHHTYTRKFPPLNTVPGPWTSSASWKELDGPQS